MGKITVIDFPYDNYTGAVQTDVDLDGITDTVATNDGYHDMIMEDDGTLHIFQDIIGFTVMPLRDFGQ